MDYELLKKAYDALEMLEALNLPISDEQKRGVAILEKRYLQENIIPTMKREIGPFLSSIRNKFKLSISYNSDKGLSFSFNDNTPKEQTFNPDNSSFRDRTRYSINGGAFLNKRRFVLAVVKKYVDSRPDISYEELEKRFPPTLNSSIMYGVFRKYDEIIAKIQNQPDLQKRFFLEPEELITLNDKTKICVYNQWGNDIERLLQVARQLYTIDSYTQ